ncbi:GntR family transcriptional regulator [Heyndrickxia sp. NPDC080065]|uniref:GntR family transcriptional regulator n=1 Tax=Heyndrickxia sp. NPDC080065 TaxID=3390568 RepID=UPI003CFCEE7E
MSLPIHISQESREPIYHQIETQIKALISSGSLPAGTPLPSIRALAKDLECSVITTRRAYHDLEQEHFIKTIQGRGTFVAEVEINLKEKIKEKTVYEAINKAIDIGLQHDYQLNDLERIFTDAVNERRK